MLLIICIYCGCNFFTYCFNTIPLRQPIFKISFNHEPIDLNNPEPILLPHLEFPLIVTSRWSPKVPHPVTLIVLELTFIDFILGVNLFAIALELAFVEFPCVGALVVGIDQNALAMIFVIEEVACVGVSLDVFVGAKTVPSVVLDPPVICASVSPENGTLPLHLPVDKLALIAFHFI